MSLLLKRFKATQIEANELYLLFIFADYLICFETTTVLIPNMCNFIKGLFKILVLCG